MPKAPRIKARFVEPGKRSGTWLKYKTLGGYLPGTYVFDSLIVGRRESGKLLFVSKVRNGFTTASRLSVASHFKDLD